VIKDVDLPGRAKKNPRTDIVIDPGMSLFYPQNLSKPPASSVRENSGNFIQAGLLTLGSSYQPRLPILHSIYSSAETFQHRIDRKLSAGKWLYAAFVPNYSGGPVPDFNGVPFSASIRHLK
jgi:hypothetical protein